MKIGARGAALGALMLSISVGATINISATTVGADASRAVVNISGNNRVITFSGSVNGISALQMVANIETISYGGTGVAVCRINGIGNPAIPGQCLGESSGGSYWSYWRAALGANRFYYSGGGAGGTTVTNATVEGWSFGSSGPPPFTSFCAVAGCAPTPPPTAAPTTAPLPPTTTSVGTNADSGSKDKNANGKSAKNGDAKTDAQPSESSNNNQSESASGGRTVKPGSRPNDKNKPITTLSTDTGSPLGIGVAAGALIIAGVAGLFIRRRRTVKNKK